MAALAVEDRILQWDARTMAALAAKCNNKSADIINKQLHLVGYLFELCYDIAISPMNIVSQSPGFESFVGGGK